MKKVRKQTKRALPVLLAVLMVVLAMPVAGFAGIELFPKAQAYSVGDHIQFGTYPQTRIDETTALKNAANAATWKSYNYFTGTCSCSDGNMRSSDYMQFADFFCNGIKYRAVTFSDYRPSNTGYQSDRTYQDDNGYASNHVYYFKYEPLTWRILDPSIGYIMCENLIDSQAYQNTICYANNIYWRWMGSDFYANDYATSSIRNWLNYDFYETAFTTGQKAKIKTTALNNDAYDPLSYGNPNYPQYNSNPTNDKIFLLSYPDAINPAYGFSSSSATFDAARKAKGTDYAKCQGLYVYSDTTSTDNGNSVWWLRSPGNYSHFVCPVRHNGEARGSNDVSRTYYGIRPACNLSNLKSDILQSDLLFSSGTYEHQPGEPLIENEAAATCKAKGSYDEVIYCIKCGDELSRTPHETATKPHTPAPAVRENVVPASDNRAGSYDEVVYCSVCKTELSRTQVTMEPLNPPSTEPVQPAQDEAPTQNLNFFQRIIEWFRNLFARLFGR